MRLNGRRGLMGATPQRWQLIHYNDGADGLVGGVWMDRIRGIDNVTPLDWTTTKVTAENGVMSFSKKLISSASADPGKQLWGRYFIVDMDIAACEYPYDDNPGLSRYGDENGRIFVDFGSTQGSGHDTWSIRLGMAFHNKTLSHNNKLLGDNTNNDLAIPYKPSLFTFPCTLRLCVMPTPEGDVIFWAHHGKYYAASKPFEGKIYGLERATIGTWKMNVSPLYGYSQYMDYSVRSLRIYRDVNFISK